MSATDPGGRRRPSTASVRQVADGYAISYSPWFARLAGALGTGPRHATLTLDRDNLSVRMGWAFAATIPLARIVSARRHPPIRTAIGVHVAGSGDWIVNGRTGDIVELRIDPPVAARAVGMTIALRRLRLSVDRPDALVAALSASPPVAPDGP